MGRHAVVMPYQTELFPLEYRSPNPTLRNPSSMWGPFRPLTPPPSHLCRAGIVRSAVQAVDLDQDLEGVGAGADAQLWGGGEGAVISTPSYTHTSHCVEIRTAHITGIHRRVKKKASTGYMPSPTHE